MKINGKKLISLININLKIKLFVLKNAIKYFGFFGFWMDIKPTVFLGSKV